MQAPRYPPRRLDADNADLLVAPDRLEIGRDVLSVAGVGVPEPFEQVERGQVVVPGYGDDRHLQAIEESARRRELPIARPLREVARHDDQVRARGRQGVRQALDDHGIDPAEMQI